MGAGRVIASAVWALLLGAVGAAAHGVDPSPAAAQQGPPGPTSEWWFWGYGPSKPLVPPALFAVMTGNGTAAPAASGVIGGCGHALGSNGSFSIPHSPWLQAQVASAHAHNLTFVPLVAGCTLVQLRALLSDEGKVSAFVEAFAADLAANDYDGFNFVRCPPPTTPPPHTHHPP